MLAGMLAGRVALVTGGGQGVGQGIARAFAEAGATVAIAQRGVEGGEAEARHLADAHGVRSRFIRTDVTDRAQVEAMVAAVVEEFGQIDILVNNAGGSFAKRLENHTDKDMEGLFALNFYSAFWAMRAAFPHMRERKWGRIINIGSLNGVNAHFYTVGYNTSKEAVRTLARTAAVEWGEYGITANTICPSATSAAAKEYFDANPEMLKNILQAVPAGRLGRAHEDIGGVAVFLASEASGYMTGNTLFVDGGGHINGVPWRPEVED